jgi:hypothetical protein
MAWELYEWLGWEAKDHSSGDMIGAHNDRKPGVLMDLPTSSIGMMILATQAITVTTHPNKGQSL